MNLKIRLKYFLLALIMVLAACQEGEKTEENRAEEYILNIKKEYAPDKRVALFDISTEEKEDYIILRGETNMPGAKEALLIKLAAEAIPFADSIEVLPASDLDGKIYGVIDVSVANLRGEGKHSAELVTQATLGTPVKIWKRTEEWYYIQTPDDYLSWVDHGGITPMDREEFREWKSSEKIIYKDPFGQSYSEASVDSKPVTDLVVGAILELEAEQGDFYKVRYPDGKAAFIAKDEASRYSEWLNNLENEEEQLVATAENLMGLPYLWGGTSSKGVDCSGYTKTIYFMNGMVIPRDASQQVREGKLIDSTGNFEDLQIGDLLFFGKKATDSTSEKVVHVGMWIGDNEFIHSSGDVHISSMDEEAENYDEFNKGRYLRTKRYLDQKSEGLKYLRQNNIFKSEGSGS